MFIFKSDLELAFMPQAALMAYMRALTTERQRTWNTATVPYFDQLARAWAEARRYCDHTDGHGVSLVQQCETVRVCSFCQQQFLPEPIAA